LEETAGDGVLWICEVDGGVTFFAETKVVKVFIEHS
jgi:hypothetical protein